MAAPSFAASSASVLSAVATSSTVSSPYPTATLNAATPLAASAQAKSSGDNSRPQRPKSRRSITRLLHLISKSRAWIRERLPVGAPRTPVPELGVCRSSFSRMVMGLQPWY